MVEGAWAVQTGRQSLSDALGEAFAEAYAVAEAAEPDLAAVDRATKTAAIAGELRAALATLGIRLSDHTPATPSGADQ
jgi:hypothetical protein